MNFLHPQGLAPLGLLKHPGAIRIEPTPTVAQLAKRGPQTQQRCADLDVTFDCGTAYDLALWPQSQQGQSPCYRAFLGVVVPAHLQITTPDTRNRFSPCVFHTLPSSSQMK